MAALDRTFAFTQMNMIAVGVRKNLNLDMSWTNDSLFDIDGVIAKGGESFRSGRVEG